MATQPKNLFHYEVEKSGDENNGWVTTVTCHGRLVRDNASEIKYLVKPHILIGGQITLDLTDVTYVDSCGLGALVSLKVSAVREGCCRLHFINLSPRVRELVSMTNLTQLFTS